MNALYDKVHSCIIHNNRERKSNVQLPCGVIPRSDFNGKSFHLFHSGQMEKVKILQKLDLGLK